MSTSPSPQPSATSTTSTEGHSNTTPKQGAAIAAAINTWYVNNARPLPWRNEHTTPWGVLVCEIMSHQTQVSRVAPLWLAWMERWPTASDLASAATADVLRMWGNLGYPRRALRLQECARVITQQHNGEVPQHLDELLALPGVGQYTAHAVASFAYGQPVPVVDVNVRRVIGRVLHARPQPGTARATDLRHAATIPPSPTTSAGLMELGALLCTARAPKCDHCPIQQHCAWFAAGRPADPTAPPPKRQAFAGTDRQVRGKVLKLLRESPTTWVPRTDVDLVWADGVQLERAIQSLLADGLVRQETLHRGIVLGLPK